MSQHDYVIANGTGSAVRSDLNNALGAIQSLNSGSSAPSTTVAYMLWLDTSNNLLKMRNGANDGWLDIGASNTANLGLALLAGATFTGEVIFNSTGSIQLPSGTTAQRPGSPTNGDIRYNSSDHQVETYKNGSWENVGSGEGGATGGNGGANAVFWENQQTVTHAYSLTASRNAGSFGPVTINSGITVTVPATSSWTIV
tara:strand:+ start:9567 stop:10163 length:597 start_codon:yes stop_codon:yes gene_type:complete